MSVWTTLLVLAGQTLGTVAGASLLKMHFMRHPFVFDVNTLSAAVRSGYFWGAGAAYASSLMLFVILLQRTPLSQLIPLQIAFALVWASCSGIFFFGDSVGLSKIVGMILLFCGAWLVSQ